MSVLISYHPIVYMFALNNMAKNANLINSDASPEIVYIPTIFVSRKPNVF